MSVRASIDPERLLALIEAGSAPPILDVRSGREFASGHVPGAVNIPFNSVRGRLAEVPGTPEGDLVIYCGHGPRAYLAAAVLRRRMQRRIIYMRGHWSRWRRAGLRVEQ